MQKLAVLLVLSFPAWSVATTLSGQLEHAASNALAQATVKVQVTLAKPVYMSDVMLRRPRTQDRVIRTDYKEQICTGYLSAQKTHVTVPSSCVTDKKYKAAHLHLTFADGRLVKKSGQSVEMRKDVALIRL